jgi:hypothetical protein
LTRGATLCDRNACTPIKEQPAAEELRGVVSNRAASQPFRPREMRNGRADVPKGHSATSLVSRARLRSRQRSERWEWLAVELGCSGGEDGGCDGARKVCVVEGGLEGRHMAGQARPTGAERILDKLDHSQPFGKETQGRPHYVHLQTTVYLFFIPSSMPESFTFASHAAPHSPCHSTEEAVLRAPRGPSFSLCILLHTVVVVVYQT